MKTTRNLLEICLLGVALLLPAVGQAQFTWVTGAPPSYTGVTITGYTGSDGTVVIPSSTNGLPVLSITANAFQGKTTVTNIVIPASLTNIFSPVFSGCTSLMAITVDPLNPAFSSADGVLYNKNQTRLVGFPEGRAGNYVVSNTVTAIAGQAFQSCVGLTNITFPAGLTNIGIFAFNYCSHLAALCFNSNAPSLGQTPFTGVSGVVYYLAGTTGWSTTFGGLTTSLWSPQVPCAYKINGGTISITHYLGSGGLVNIPGTISGTPVTSIAPSAFQNVASITSVTFPTNVTSIGAWAFSGCTSLTNIMIGSNVTSIGGGAFASFANCSRLAAIAVDALNGVYSSTDGVLFDKNQTVLIQCPGGKTGSCNIPATVTNIMSTALTPCFNLTAINVDSPNSFYSSLDGVLFVPNQTTLLQYPQGKAGNYTVPGTVTNIAGYAFASSSNLTGVIIGDNVINLDGEAFQSCSGLTNVSIGNGVTSIGTFAFNACGKLASVTLGTNVTSIGGAAFQSCNSLTSVMIPNSVTNIADWAFNQCYSLTNVTVGNGVTAIGTYAFLSCPSLAGIYFQGNAPTNLGSPLFPYENTIVYYLPNTTGWTNTFADRPTALWLPQAQTRNANFGVHSNQFGFDMNWASGQTVVVEACQDLIHWLPVQTNTLTTGSSYFSDPQWMNYPGRFYRLRSP